MTDQELIEIKNYLIQNSQQVSDIPEVQSTSGVDSLPAIKSQVGQDDQVVRVPLTLLSPQLRMNGKILQYKNPEGQWINIYDFSTIPSGGGTFSGTYKNNNKIIQKLGALQKGFDASDGIDYTELFNKIFFPNYNNEFPQNKIFIGKSDQIPNKDSILSLSSPIDYYNFDYNDFMDKNYFIIALPGQFYLKRIEDSNGMNIIGCFDLTYKSIQTTNISDIYNVYISPKLFYNDDLELTFTTKTGSPVQTTLNSGIISVNDIIPTVNSITIIEAIKSVINSVKIAQREVPVLLNSILITQKDLQPNINSLYINIRDVQPILNSIDIQQGIRSVLKGLSISQGYHSNINSITITEAVKSNINSINIKDGRSIINSISIKQADKAIINSVNISKGIKSILNNIYIKEGKSVLNNIFITEATKSNINSILINDGRSIINSIIIKEGSSKIKSIQISEAIKAMINSITIK